MKEKKGDKEIDQLLRSYSDNISVLEEAIDVSLQAKYFKESKQQKATIDKTLILEQKDKLFDPNVSIEDKKVLLCQLASLNEVEAFHTIEKYKEQADVALGQWAILAYQESKMLMQSVFLDHKPIFISTGLGGKGKLLRYFVVIFTRNKAVFSPFQEELVESEVRFAFKGEGAELEEMGFRGCYVAFTGLVSLNTGLKKLLSGIIKQCNELGDFLDTSILVTNVKKLSAGEIEYMLDKKTA
ncbi:hypothetical protein J1N10_18635 [Carboxylicivirga sp. A043]|uniref:hypothetical protein n=1 Tax=Carboxylicivirga litoralis TaxID=2816963 RepID=UPI0021CB8B08|nr:hypothetical protein [Carboxylicivirga sp. A043]MCU4157998.1 hypothetical protein [Carboxylicivirga sp. A043]